MVDKIALTGCCQKLRDTGTVNSIAADHEVPALKKQEIVDLVNDLIVSQDDMP